jgi:hypothetical protein
VRSDATAVAAAAAALARDRGTLQREKAAFDKAAAATRARLDVGEYLCFWTFTFLFPFSLAFSFSVPPW